MRTFTLREVERMIHRAEQDVMRLLQWQNTLSHVPVKIDPSTFNFLANEWPIVEEQYRTGEYIQIWRTKVDEQIAFARRTIEANKKWVSDRWARIGRGNRCALPKKKQRLMGLLPPV